MTSTPLLPHKVIREDRPDGAIILRSGFPLGPIVATSAEWLRHWAREAPERVFLAERSGEGWREITYAAALLAVQGLAKGLLARGMVFGDRLMILSGNGVDHGLLTLAAHMIGVQTAPVAEQYSLIPAAHDRLRHAVGLIKPKMVFAVDGAKFEAALALNVFDGVTKCVSAHAGPGITALSDLMTHNGDLAAAVAQVGPKTIVKILMTSGSTSDPKGVEVTHEMMCVNQTQLADALPFLRVRPPVIVDWLPWNHVFGGSHNFNMVLANGGSLYIDDGKPMRGLLFDRTLDNLGQKVSTISFNVPVGYALLLEAMERDEALRQRFFADLDMLFYAGASLPNDVWNGLERMAMDVRGDVPLMTSSWGLTETGPGCTIGHEPLRGAGVIGVPLTGVDVKLAPEADGRFEICVRGRNIMQRYLDDPIKTAEAFDTEGYFATGDAVSMVDPDHPELGLRFEGRIAEDFKLATGTWVRATVLRLEALAALAPFAADVVVTGHDREEIGLLIMPNRAALADLSVEDGGEVISGPGIAAAISAKLADLSDAGTDKGAGRGSASRVARALVMSAPASLAAGEITAKGNLNNRKMLALRADLVARLYDDADLAVIRPVRG
jgi:feruloyl-CoA synthase